MRGLAWAPQAVKQQSRDLNPGCQAPGLNCAASFRRPSTPQSLARCGCRHMSVVGLRRTQSPPNPLPQTAAARSHSPPRLGSPSRPSGPGHPWGLPPAQACPGPAAHAALPEPPAGRHRGLPRGTEPRPPGSPDKGRQRARSPGTRSAAAAPSPSSLQGPGLGALAEVVFK